MLAEWGADDFYLYTEHMILWEPEVVNAVLLEWVTVKVQSIHINAL
jgi:hypothetical protein